MLAFLHPDGAIVFGTGVEEVCRGRTEIERLLREDFALWDAATFGDVRNLACEEVGGLATAFFEVGFTAVSARRARSFVLRFATAWRVHDEEWRLVQSMNAVATEGESAAELVRRAEPR